VKAIRIWTKQFDHGEEDFKGKSLSKDWARRVEMEVDTPCGSAIIKNVRCGRLKEVEEWTKEKGKKAWNQTSLFLGLLDHLNAHFCKRGKNLLVGCSLYSGSGWGAHS